MKTLFLCLSILLANLVLFAQGKTYYIASNGNDNNTGTSSTYPFRTLQKVSSLTLGPGDKILLNKGDVFNGELIIKHSTGSATSPIIVNSYGVGKTPIIDCSYTTKNWSKYKGNIWRTACSTQCGDTVSVVLSETKALPLGRYPNGSANNKGFLTIAQHVDRNRIISKENLGDTNWTGAEIVYYPQQWILERCKVLSQNNGSLTLDGNTTYDIKDNWGFFIQNHIKTLDEEGEWFYDKTDKSLYVYSDTNPESKNITASEFNNGVSIVNSSFVTVKNINITTPKRNGIFVSNSSNLSFLNLSIKNCGESGLLMSGAGSDIDIENSTIESTNDNGVDIEGYNNLTFKKNILKNIATVRGMGKGKDGHYFGLFFVNPSQEGASVIANNAMYNIGYAGIRYQSSNITIQNNYINKFDVIKGDGGGIYTFNYTNKKVKPYKNQHILSNIITNGSFSGEGTVIKDNESNTHGIYLDMGSQNVEVRNNTVSNCATSGIYLLAANNITVADNTCFNNGAALYILDKPIVGVHNIDVQKNIFYAKGTGQLIGRFTITKDNPMANYGKFDNNYYSDPSSGKNSFIVKDANIKSPMSLDAWKTKFNNDKATRKAVRTMSTDTDKSLLYYNNTEKPKVISLNGQFKDINNKVYNNSVTLQPFTSVILSK